MANEYEKAALYVVCPMCDKKKCVGRFICPEIKTWAENAKGEHDAETK